MREPKREMSDLRNCGKCGRNVQAGPGTRVTKKGLVHNICPSRKHVTMKMGARRPARRKQGCRGFKRDEFATQRAGFLDSRSHQSLDGHLLLFGRDKEIQFENIFLLRNPDKLTREEGEWHHLRCAHNDYRRCDCIDGGEFIRIAEHKKEHVRVQLKSVPMEVGA